MGKRSREHRRRVIAGKEPLYRGMPDKDKPAAPIFVTNEEKTAVEDEPATDESTKRLAEAMKRLGR